VIKTLLINPPFSLEERYGNQLKSFGAITEPMALAYLAGSLKKEGLNVEILDAAALEYSIQDVLNHIIQNKYHLIGITFLTPMFDIIKELTYKIKKSCVNVKIIVGGPHPTALPEKTLKEIPAVDYVCIGEGEKTILELVNNFYHKKNIKKIKGICYRDYNKIIKKPSRSFEKNLDIISKPARDLLPMDKYKLTASRTKGSEFCPTIIVARGCPFDCQFCSHPFGRTFRYHSIERIIEEIRDLKNNYKVEQVNLEADTLTINKKFIKSLCETIIKQNLEIRWTCESRVDTLDEETLKIMKKAGCWQISYGIESGSQRLLDIIHKGVTKEQIKRTIVLSKKIGITCRGFYMLGLPSETNDESMETIKFAIELDTLWAQFTITIPYPGTPMFNELDKQRKIRHYNWSDYNTWSGWADKKLPYLPDGRDENEIKNLQKKAIRMYYLRPKPILRFFQSVTSISDVKKYAKGFSVLMKSTIKKSK
jgi:radical SAM superfamily enzyme YgiQ (UPF0313 family)